MKHTLHLSGTALLALGLVLSTNAAEKGLYFNAEAGANWATDADVRINGFGGEAETDIGTRFGASVGYNFSRYLGVEFDTGWLWNEFKDSNTSISHMPFVVNGIFRYPNTTKFEPYAGVGIGGVYSSLDVDDGGVEDDDGDVGFGWQIVAGIRYKFQENMSLGLGYKYLGTGETDYDIGGARVELDNTHNHSFGVVFNMTF